VEVTYKKDCFNILAGVMNEVDVAERVAVQEAKEAERRAAGFQVEYGPQGVSCGGMRISGSGRARVGDMSIVGHGRSATISVRGSTFTVDLSSPGRLTMFEDGSLEFH